MENESQPNIPPFQPTPAPVVAPPNNWLKIFIFVLIGLAVVIGSVYAGMQIGKNQIPKQQQIVKQPTIVPTQTIIINPTKVSPTEQIPTINPNKDRKIFSDPNLVGFSFEYASKDWEEKTEDLKLCNGQQCSPSIGRVISLTNKNYPDPLRSIILTMTLKNEHDSAYDNNQICFPSENIQQVGEWYKVQNPYSTSSDEMRDQLWQRWFYKKNIISETQGKKCIFGSVNEPKGSTIPILYQGKQTTLSIELSNKFDLNKNNIADEIIKTMKITN